MRHSFGSQSRTQSQESLSPANAKAVCLIAALFGDVRLLDNLELGGEDA